MLRCFGFLGVWWLFGVVEFVFVGWFVCCCIGGVVNFFLFWYYKGFGLVVFVRYFELVVDWFVGLVVDWFGMK